MQELINEKIESFKNDYILYSEYPECANALEITKKECDILSDNKISTKRKIYLIDKIIVFGGIFNNSIYNPIINDDILQIIFSHIDEKTIGSIMQTCKVFKNLADTLYPKYRTVLFLHKIKQKPGFSHIKNNIKLEYNAFM